MISGRFILSQILDLIHRETLSRLASRFHADSRVRHFGVHQLGSSPGAGFFARFVEEDESYFGPRRVRGIRGCQYVGVGIRSDLSFR
jgi:hypothetical protein